MIGRKKIILLSMSQGMRFICRLDVQSESAVGFGDTVFDDIAANHFFKIFVVGFGNVNNQLTVHLNFFEDILFFQVNGEFASNFGGEFFFALRPAERICNGR